ncbi:hypothetical protein [Microbacterium radiodurans]|uniref:Uncharacterized protein n=1 Tax=Microbacterium radiodurans TaxID=661398 RepID=A0A5J5IMQ0_9MICO|nr:hypothetical protein [Microbacterium radiodurans]KAA9083774.1 hypothetical protein F6B42_14610 [Microbacterium radiodurans]
MSTKRARPILFWVSYAVMLGMALIVGFGVGPHLAHPSFAFIAQLLLAGAWVTCFYRYRPWGRRQTDHA